MYVASFLIFLKIIVDQKLLNEKYKLFKLWTKFVET